jgi:hypothetical protein
VIPRLYRTPVIGFERTTPMDDPIKTHTTNAATATAANSPAAPLTGLFDEMQGLMALMPGAALSAQKPLLTDDEIEAMFDNMPV